MILCDKTGRKIKIGSEIDTLMNGMYSGKVIGIEDAPLQIPGRPPVPPHIVVGVQFWLQIYKEQTGWLFVPHAYIVAEPDPNDPIVREAIQRHEDKPQPSKLVV